MFFYGLSKTVPTSLLITKRLSGSRQSGVQQPLKKRGKTCKAVRAGKKLSYNELVLKSFKTVR
jgi:hypothetical protein